MEHYRQRGTVEDLLGKWKGAIHSHLSHNEFMANEALLRLGLQVSMLRIEHEAGSCMDLGRFQRDVMKAGGRVVKASRRLMLQVASVVVPVWERLVAGDCRRGSHRRVWRSPPRNAFAQEVRRL